MKFDGFYGNLRIKEYLSNAVDGGQISHAFLFSGADGIGKKTLAGITARALVCQSDGEKPCGECSACVKSARESHPDIIHIRRSEASIKVNEIRALKQDAYLRPNDGEKKVYLIHEADSMTQEAQDALLKILEEPPAFTVFLLLCYNEKSMLETVRSRCVRLPLAPLCDEEMRKLLKQRFPECTDEEISKLCKRSNGIAGSVIDQNSEDEALPHAKRIIQATAKGDDLAIAESFIAVEKSKRDELLSILDCLSACLRDALVYNVSSCADGEDICVLLAGNVPNAALIRLSDSVTKAKSYCSQNIGVAHITGFLTCEFCQAVKK